MRSSFESDMTKEKLMMVKIKTKLMTELFIFVLIQLCVIVIYLICECAFRLPMRQFVISRKFLFRSRITKILVILVRHIKMIDFLFKMFNYMTKQISRVLISTV